MKIKDCALFKSGENPDEDGDSRALKQIKCDEAFMFGRIDHAEWSRWFDHLSSPGWAKPLPPPIQYLPIIG